MVTRKVLYTILYRTPVKQASVVPYGRREEESLEVVVFCVHWRSYSVRELLLYRTTFPTMQWSNAPPLLIERTHSFSRIGSIEQFVSWNRFIKQFGCSYVIIWTLTLRYCTFNALKLLKCSKILLFITGFRFSCFIIIFVDHRNGNLKPKNILCCYIEQYKIQADKLIYQLAKKCLFYFIKLCLLNQLFVCM